MTEPSYGIWSIYGNRVTEFPTLAEAEAFIRRFWLEGLATITEDRADAGPE